MGLIFNKNKDDKETFLKYVSNFRKKNVPEEYNQIKLMDFLLNDEINHYISISNRTDGKSFNYIHFLIDLSVNYGVGFTMVGRHYTVRSAFMRFIKKIIDKSKIYAFKDFDFIASPHFVTVIYKDQELGIITDLNAATDLKYESNLIEDFPILVYEEFLALEGDYLPDEWDKLRTIYSSVDRNGGLIPLIKRPKILYLGNAVNFSSPILSELELFNILEKHPVNTVKQYKDVMLEVHVNENANKKRNLTAFREEEDPMTHARFRINNYAVADTKDKLSIEKNARHFYIKANEYFIKVTYERETYNVLLSVSTVYQDYSFNTNLKDNKKDSIYLKESFFSENHYKKYDNNEFLFDNNYSKDVILSSYDLAFLKIMKCINRFEYEHDESNFEILEKQYENNYIERTKRSLYARFNS